ncbi:hypothetical protein KY366_06335 [Candidatus Woesearchaeota archaeon]|nr:hypothetical protein [Candidatus Woesearchaeota archaeon]
MRLREIIWDISKDKNDSEIGLFSKVKLKVGSEIPLTIREGGEEWETNGKVQWTKSLDGVKRKSKKKSGGYASLHDAYYERKRGYKYIICVRLKEPYTGHIEYLKAENRAIR